MSDAAVQEVPTTTPATTPKLSANPTDYEPVCPDSIKRAMAECYNVVEYIVGVSNRIERRRGVLAAMRIERGSAPLVRIGWSLCYDHDDKHPDRQFDVFDKYKGFVTAFYRLLRSPRLRDADNQHPVHMPEAQWKAFVMRAKTFFKVEKVYY